jgi:integrase
MPLVIYRRHTKSCTKGYPQNHRIFPPRTAADRRADCHCPIVASGTLRLEQRRIKHLSFDSNAWDAALATAALWERWGAITNPNPAAANATITLADAAHRFLVLKGPHGENIGRFGIRKYRIMLEQRIAPWCAEHGITFITGFDDPTTVTVCFLSFKNLNPHRNKRGQPQPALPVPLSDAMRGHEISRYRAFLEFCVERGWLRHNHAMKIRLGKRNTSPKYGLTPEEEAQVWDAIDAGTVRCHGLPELCMVMRWTGLRISDATALDETQLVRGDQGWVIQIMSTQKTGEWVRVPITRAVADALHGLPFKGTHDGRRYWFWTGNGNPNTAINNWRARITELFHAAQDGNRFSHPASPHTFRHTFAIDMLNRGVDIKTVSRWLGHRRVETTEKYYGHANRATNLTSEMTYHEALADEATVVQRRRITEARQRAKGLKLVRVSSRKNEVTTCNAELNN